MAHWIFKGFLSGVTGQLLASMSYVPVSRKGAGKRHLFNCLESRLNVTAASENDVGGNDCDETVQKGNTYSRGGFNSATSRYIS